MENKELKNKIEFVLGRHLGILLLAVLGCPSHTDETVGYVDSLGYVHMKSTKEHKI